MLLWLRHLRLHGAGIYSKKTRQNWILRLKAFREEQLIQKLLITIYCNDM